LPQSSVSRESVWISNDRIALRLVRSDNEQPLFLLAGRELTGWKTLATGLSLVSIQAGEEGQRPWSETMRWRSARVLPGDKTAAQVSIVGTVGSRWKAEMVLELQAQRSAIEGTLRLTALRDMRCYGIELPRLLVAPEAGSSSPFRTDGTPLSLPFTESVLPEKANLAARKNGAVTFGIAWPSAHPFSDWNWNRLPDTETGLTATLGALCGEARGNRVGEGETITMRFRLFALSPSITVRDAMNFALP
jgi:hypothetical protein